MLTDNDKTNRGVPAVCTLLGKYILIAFLICAIFCIFKNFFIQFGLALCGIGILCALSTISLIVVFPFLAKR